MRHLSHDNLSLLLTSRIESGLQKCIGKGKAVRTKTMIARLKKEGFTHVSGAKIRQAIHHLRTVKGMFICGDNYGYYVPENAAEMDHQIFTMKSRIREISEACNALIKTKKIRTEQQQLFQ